MEMTRYGDIGNATAGYYETMLLSHALPVIISEPFGLTKRLPKNKTRVMQFRRSQPYKPAKVPLREGVTPDGSPFGYDTISCQINQYGDYTPLTNVVEDTSIDDVFEDSAQRMGEQIAETREALTTDVICSGTAFVYGDNGATRAAITKTGVLTGQRVRNEVAALKKQKSKRFREVVAPSRNYQTFGIEQSYIALAHTDLEPNIRDLQAGNAKFIPTVRYGNYGIASPNEAGNFENTRFILGEDFPFFEGAGAEVEEADKADYQYTAVGVGDDAKYDVYPLLLLGRESFGTVFLGTAGMGSVSPRVLKPRPRGSDPLGQRGSVGWIMWHCALILNEQWMRRMEVPRKLT